MSDLDWFIGKCRELRYGDFLRIDLAKAEQLFPMTRRPTLLEVVADIESAMSKPRDEFVSSLLPSDTYCTVAEKLGKALGPGFVVSELHHMPVMVVSRPLHDCPKCGGHGYYEEMEPLQIARLGDPSYMAQSVSFHRVECDHSP
jgi:hypothetical protein